MEKKTYYVSVQAGTVVTSIDDSSFEFVIQATDKEIQKLEELFEALDDAEDETFTRGMIPAIPYHQDEENDTYDASLRRVYELIHQLGNEQTRRTIEGMGVLKQTQTSTHDNC